MIHICENAKQTLLEGKIRHLDVCSREWSEDWDGALSLILYPCVCRYSPAVGMPVSEWVTLPMGASTASVPFMNPGPPILGLPLASFLWVGAWEPGVGFKSPLGPSPQKPRKGPVPSKYSLTGVSPGTMHMGCGAGPRPERLLPLPLPSFPDLCSMRDFLRSILYPAQSDLWLLHLMKLHRCCRSASLQDSKRQ